MTNATGESCDSYTTPILRQAGGRTELIVMGGQMLDAYDPSTGKQLWALPDLIGNRVIPSPVAAGDLVYAIQGMRKPLIAVRPGGEGRRTRDDIVWQYDQGTSDSACPVVAGDLLVMLSNDGIVRCFDRHTGRLHWKQRVKGEYRASPLVAERRVYFLNMEGLVTVVSASSRFERLAENQLDDQTTASPVVSDGKLYLRGKKWLYCLSK